MTGLTPEGLADTGRDALALVAAQCAGNDDAIDVILGNADLRVLPVVLAGMVQGVLELAGTDPAAYITACQRHLLGQT